MWVLIAASTVYIIATVKLESSHQQLRTFFFVGGGEVKLKRGREKGKKGNSLFIL
jgi:hypothetical protein